MTSTVKRLIQHASVTRFEELNAPVCGEANFTDGVSNCDQRHSEMMTWAQNVPFFGGLHLLSQTLEQDMVRHFNRFFVVVQVCQHAQVELTILGRARESCLGVHRRKAKDSATGHAFRVTVSKYDPPLVFLLVASKHTVCLSSVNDLPNFTLINETSLERTQHVVTRRFASSVYITPHIPSCALYYADELALGHYTKSLPRIFPRTYVRVYYEVYSATGLETFACPGESGQGYALRGVGFLCVLDSSLTSV